MSDRPLIAWGKWTCCLIVLSLLLMPSSIGAVETLYQSDFSKPSLENWKLVAGNWRINDGVLQAGESTTSHFAVTGSDDWTDYRVETQVKISGSAEPKVKWLKAYLFVRVQNNKDFYRFGFHGDSHCVDLYRCVNGTWTMLGSYPFEPQPDRWYTLRVDVVGARIRGFVDGELVIDRRDGKLLQGGIGLGCTEDSMMTAWKHVLVTRWEKSGQLAVSLGARLLIEKKVSVEIDAIEVAAPADLLRATVDLRRVSDGEAVAHADVDHFGSSAVATSQLDVSQIVPGKYAVDVQVKNAAGETLASASKPFEQPPAPTWRGSQAGICDRVLPPWTPLEIDTAPTTVRCWGRKYVFADAMMPTQITTAGQPLLASPIRLSAIVNDRSEDLQTGELRVSGRTPTDVVLDGSTMRSDVQSTVKATIEYDGMLRLDCSLTSQRDVTVSQLFLEISLRPEQATLYHYWPGHWGSAKNSGAIPHDAMSLPFKPIVWLGNEDGGLAWFMESDHDWSNAASDNVIEVQSSQEAVTLRIRLIDQKVTLSAGASRKYTIGLQATPVKPIPRDWHEWRICHCGSYDLVDRVYRTSATLTYPARGDIDLRRGTMEAWIVPSFDSNIAIDSKDPARGRENRDFFAVSTANQHIPQAGFYWNIDDRGMRFYVRKGSAHPIVVGGPMSWKANEPHHVALTWGDAICIYLDGQLVASQPFRGLLGEEIAVDDDMVIQLGGERSDFTVDELRISNTPRSTFDLRGPFVADESTLLLDPLNETASAGGSGERTVAAKIADKQVSGGYINRAGQSVPTRFGSGIALSQAGPPVLMLDHLAAQGVKTIVFHEHWTDIQNYSMVGHDEQLKRLVGEVHRRGMKLLVYYGYELSSIAPEWNYYGHEVLVKSPEAAMPTTGYLRQPPQHANIVCYNSPWQDFLAEAIRQTLDTYHVDGVYLDGTIEPFGCPNYLHGCGYQRPDGTWSNTYPIFAVRNLMKRIYTMCTDVGGLVNPHQSTCCMIPTLSFSHSYWDGEQFGSGELAGDPLKQLPLETFRAEFMGRNWGVPAEFLVYERPPTWTMDDALAFSMLHDVCVRPGGVAALDRIAPIWHAWSQFGVQAEDCRWHPYWKNQDIAEASPSTVKVSLYSRASRGVLLVAANLGTAPVDARVQLRSQRLQLDHDLKSAHDALSGEQVEFSEESLQLAIPPMRMRMVRVE